jgi:thioredoxin 1
MSTSLPVITKVTNAEHLRVILANNPGVVIIKFGAKWCGPCKTIDADVDKMFSILPPSVQSVKLDIDENNEIYSFLKAKRMVNGVPVILSYKKGNEHYVPNDIVVGADKYQLKAFFERSIESI